MPDVQSGVVAADAAWTFLGVWIAAALVHGLWRSLGAAKQDPLRESGPIL